MQCYFRFRSHPTFFSHLRLSSLTRIISSSFHDLTPSPPAAAHQYRLPPTPSVTTSGRHASNPAPLLSSLVLLSTPNHSQLLHDSQNRVLNACVKRKAFHRANKLFAEMTVRSVITYNIVICGIMNQEGFAYFTRMLLESIHPDDITFNALLRTCKELRRGTGVIICQQTHCFLAKLGFGSNCFVASALVGSYAEIGLPADARRAFDQVLCKDLVMWNVMVSCYASNGLPFEACDLYNAMSSCGVTGDAYTFCSLLRCGFVGTCDLAKQLHGSAVKLSHSSDLMVASALVHMYVENGGLDDGRKTFDDMNSKNVVTWNTMIVGYGRQGHGNETMRLLRDMLRQGFAADELTLASVLSSCGHSSSTDELIQVHEFSIKGGFELFPSVSNALVNAYSKCGNMADASRSFTSTAKPDLVTWTSMINAHWTNGMPDQALDVFEKMVSCGVRPDDVAFLGVLSACSHGGLLIEGFHYFNLMTACYHIIPNEDHYTCLIDLLSRSGLLNEAFTALSLMPIVPRRDTLAAFAGACKIHGKIDAAKWAAEMLQQFEPNEAVNQTLLSSLYAAIEDWSRAGEIRKRCNHKALGCSFVV
uniref:Pentatricopeptide repeat-containing protein n=1 Tax=Kalanchoe fedtschenkoi TaxID=63787 RepID=A0A7N0T2V8_KALFE